MMFNLELKDGFWCIYLYVMIKYIWLIYVKHFLFKELLYANITKQLLLFVTYSTVCNKMT